MPRCDVISLSSGKACAGKCVKDACGQVVRVWIVAACEGMVSLFEKGGNGVIIPRSPVFPSLEKFQQSMNEAESAHAFDHLIIVGSSNDIAWVHSSLSERAARHIAAEIKYPLLAGWFKEAEPMSHLSQALTSVLA